MRTLRSPGLLPLLVLAGCATGGAPNFEGSGSRAEPCEECELMVENRLGHSVIVSYYQGAGSLRPLGSVNPWQAITFTVQRPIWKDRLTLVASSGGRTICRGAVDLPDDKPARFTVGLRTSCRPERP